ncbi:MAG: phosphoribosyltransferase family protein [Dehalococcoidales bacterium]
MAAEMAKVTVLAYSDDAFLDREEAGRLLGQQMETLRGQDLVVLGIPRGGVVVAAQLARALDADLDVVLSRKLRTPGREELAMGAVSEDGGLSLNDDLVAELGIGGDAVERERQLQLSELARRRDFIRRDVPAVPTEGRQVIVTDDGVATGATMVLALEAVRRQHPARLYAALPVVSEDALVRIIPLADEVVCLRVPRFFAAVGQFYRRFDQVDDTEVLRILKEERVHGGVR